MVGGCDDREYEVTIFVPHIYRVRAAHEVDAQHQAVARFAASKLADAIGFPEDLRIREIPATQAE